jgi:uncharacterized protein YodC (DUF2158 family)
MNVGDVVRVGSGIVRAVGEVLYITKGGPAVAIAKVTAIGVSGVLICKIVGLL